MNPISRKKQLLLLLLSRCEDVEKNELHNEELESAS